MPARLTTLIALVTVMIITGYSRAEPVPSAPAKEPPPQATDILINAPECPIRNPDSRTDVFVGLPIAARYQNRLLGRLWGEVGAGFYVIVPDLFAGFRYDCELFQGNRDLVAIRPGVDGNFLINPLYAVKGWLGGGPMSLAGVSTDVDCIWDHTWTDRLHGEFGLKLGAMTVFNGSRTVVVPNLAFLFGCQF